MEQRSWKDDPVEVGGRVRALLAGAREDELLRGAQGRDTRLMREVAALLPGWPMGSGWWLPTTLAVIEHLPGERLTPALVAAWWGRPTAGAAVPRRLVAQLAERGSEPAWLPARLAALALRELEALGRRGAGEGHTVVPWALEVLCARAEVVEGEALDAAIDGALERWPVATLAALGEAGLAGRLEARRLVVLLCHREREVRTAAARLLASRPRGAASS